MLLLKIMSSQKELAILYIRQLNEAELITYKIAKDHLGSSFNIYKSSGFKKWKEIYKKS